MVVCKNCGSIDDYRTTQAGPHLKAICNGCDKYIKFLPQNKTPKKMADKIINLSIDVKKIKKEWLYVGEKGTYADLTVLLNDTPDQYGNNGMIVQNPPKAVYEAEKDLPKEQRTKGPILGNCKVRGAGGQQAPAANQQQQSVADDLPF